MSSTNPQSPLVWIDLEFTDFDPAKGEVVEIATVVTDKDLDIIAKGPNLVIHQPDSILSSMPKWNKEHFSDSGLLEAIRQSKISIKEAEDTTLNFLEKYCAKNSALLAGSSVYMDRQYLEVHMPDLFNFFHYRIIDTNTLKELMHRWYPHLPDFPKIEPHRSLPDILESINELKYYREQIFK